MKNYEIVNLEAAVLVETKAGKVLKLQPTSRNNMANKAVRVKNAEVAQEIKEAAVGPKAKVQSFVIDGELGESNTPKKIKLNGATFTKIAGKGIIEVKGAAPAVPEEPVVEETPVAEVKKEEKPVMPDFESSIPSFNFASLKSVEPTPEPEDEKDEVKEEKVEGKLSDFALPGFEDEKEEPVKETVVPEPTPVVEETPVAEAEKPQKEVKVEESIKEEAPVVEEKKEVEKPKVEVKEETKVDSPNELAAQLKSAIDEKIKAAEEKAKEDAMKEIEKAKAEAEEANKKAAKVQEELEKTNVDLKNALKDLEAAKDENKNLADKVTEANRYREAVAQVIGEIGAREEGSSRKMAA